MVCSLHFFFSFPQINCEIKRDTAGQERFRSITRGYYRGAIGALIVFDVTQSTSFQNIMKWLEELHDYSEKQTIVVLIGNKTDLKNQRQISTEDAKEFAAKNDLLYMETSAREGQNIHAAFKLLVNGNIESMLSYIKIIYFWIKKIEIYKKHKKHQREDLTSNVVIKPNGNPITLPNSPKSDQENNEKCKC